MTSRLQIVTVALGVLAALLIVTVTGGFSVVTADRSMVTEYVPDDEANLGIEPHSVTVDTNVSNTSEVQLLTVTNNLPTDLSVDVDLEPADDHPEVVLVDDEIELDPGDTATIEATVDCTTGEASDDGTEASTDVEIHLQASGDGIDIELTRSVAVNCE